MFLVCGEALYDLFVANEGSNGQLNIEARPGGSPFNVAIGMARLGASSALLTGLSNDLLGTRLASVLGAEGVNSDYLVRTGARTTLSVVGVDETGGPSYIFYGIGSADCSLTEADLPTIGNDVTGVHFGSYSIAVEPVAAAFETLAQRQADLFLSLDPNVRPTIQPDLDVWRDRIDRLRPLTNLIKVSDEDLGILYPDVEPFKIVRAWAKDGPALVVLTQGDGDVLAMRGDEVFRATPPATTVVDTVGAGDTFMAALLAEMSMHRDPAAHLVTVEANGIETLLRRAATAAAITCGRRGADLPTTAQLNKVLGEQV